MRIISLLCIEENVSTPYGLLLGWYRTVIKTDTSGALHEQLAILKN